MRTKVKQLVLFVKIDGIYKAYVRFAIDDIIPVSHFKLNELKKVSDVNPIQNGTYSNFLKISNVETMGIPTNYLSIRLGVNLYDVAFKGSSSALTMI